MAILSVRGVSEDVQRALRVRAAETGETMGAIVERALRKELGMMEETNYANLRIYHKVFGGNLFNGWDEDEVERIDEEASIHKYAEELRKRLEGEFPGAEVIVDCDANASGGTDTTWIEDIGDDYKRYYATSPGHPLEQMAMKVREIAGLLYEDSYWVVMEDGE